MKKKNFLILVLLKLLEFNKYNKGLRLYATLFDLPTEVFEVNSFVDIKVLEDNTIGIIYNNLYDMYVETKLKNNVYYFNNRYVTYNDKKYYAYILRVEDKEDTLTFNTIKGEYYNFLFSDFIMKTCIKWKKYLDDSFYEFI